MQTYPLHVCIIRRIEMKALITVMKTVHSLSTCYPMHSRVESGCLCNYNSDLVIYSAASLNSYHIGILRKFDCKPTASDTEETGFRQIQIQNQIGFVQMDAQIRIKLCSGNPSPPDIATTYSTTSTSVTTMHTASKTTNAPTTRVQRTTAQTTMAMQTTTAVQATTYSTTSASVTTMHTASKTTNAPTTRVQRTTAQTTMAMQTTTALQASGSTNASTTRVQRTTAQTTMAMQTTTALQATTYSNTSAPVTTMQTTSESTNVPTTRVQRTITQTTMAMQTTTALQGHLEVCPKHLKTDIALKGGFIGQYDDFCYELVDWIRGFDGAEAHCKSQSGTLVSITDQGEQNYIERFLSSHNYIQRVWIGLNDKDSEGNLTWTSGKPVSYTNFKNHYNGHSKFDHDNNDCFTIEQGGEWVDLPCGISVSFFNFGEQHPFICQYSKYTISSGCWQNIVTATQESCSYDVLSATRQYEYFTLHKWDSPPNDNSDMSNGLMYQRK